MIDGSQEERYQPLESCDDIAFQLNDGLLELTEYHQVLDELPTNDEGKDTRRYWFLIDMKKFWNADISSETTQGRFYNKPANYSEAPTSKS